MNITCRNITQAVFLKKVFEAEKVKKEPKNEKKLDGILRSVIKSRHEGGWNKNREKLSAFAGGCGISAASSGRNGCCSRGNHRGVHLGLHSGSRGPVGR
jgi:hypothetical protein